MAGAAATASAAMDYAVDPASAASATAASAVVDIAAAADLASIRDKALRRLRWVLALVIGLPALGYAVIGAYLWRQEFADAQVRITASARIAEEQALKLFETNEMVLGRMLDLTRDQDDAQLLARGAQVHQQLKQMASGLAQVQLLLIQGADSRAVANSRLYPPPRQLDYSDREWYRVARSSTPPRVFVTEQGISRATGEPFFDMSRRRISPDGQFAGTVHVSLRPKYLTDFYAELAAAEPGLHVLITRTDGRLLARWPADAAKPMHIDAPDPLRGLLDRRAASGQGRFASTMTGTDQITAYRRLEAYPLYVVAAVGVPAVAAAWRETMAPLTLLAAPAELGLVGLAALALRRTRREFGAAQRLEHESVRRQQAELDLLRSQKLEALGRLTSGVAHDFNNLLMVMMNTLAQHRRQHPAGADSPALSALGRAVESGTKLTRHLLTYSRSRPLQPQRIDLRLQQPALQQLLRPVLHANTALTLTVAPDTAAIDVDPDELDLALINLAVNANHAMPDGGRVDLEIRNAASDEFSAGLGQFVLLAFDDTGLGIDPGIAHKVFEPFFTTKPIGSGTGLGLSQVQALCESAGGGASVAPRPGGGTRVALFFRAGAAP